MWTSSNLLNESDVEQKFLTPLLSSDQGLRVPMVHIQTKKYLRDFTIGKRAASRGHVPDAIIDFYGIPTAVIEAKPPGEDLSEAIREAKQYALHLNNQFPSEINPVKHLLVTNGQSLLICDWDSTESIATFDASQLFVASVELLRLRETFDFQSQLIRSQKVRKILTPPVWRSAVSKLDSLDTAKLDLGSNPFAADLRRPMTQFLAKDTGRDSDEIIDRGFVSTAETTRYEKEVENLLRDSLTRSLRPDVYPIHTGFNCVLGGDGKIVEKRTDKSKSSLTLLIGSVGSGKSIFIDRFFKKLVSPERKKNLVFLVVDFNNSPSDPASTREWLNKETMRAIQRFEDSKNGGFDCLATRRRIFSKFIARDKKTLCGDGVGAMTDEEFDKHVRQRIMEWQESPEHVIGGFHHHYTGEVAATDLVVFFDNADKRTHPEQLSVIQSVLGFLNEFPCTAILSLRDETYDIYKAQPPLDAISKPRVLRVEPPRLVDVLQRRVELMIEYIEANLPDRLSYYLQGGITYEYSKSALKGYVRAVFNELFNTKRKHRVVLEAVSGRNIRESLDLFISILCSPHLADHAVGFARGNQRDQISATTFYRTLMRRSHAYHTVRADPVGIQNVLQTDGRSSTSTNLLLPEVLTILNRERRKPSDIGVNGYRPINYLLRSPELQSFSPEDIIWSARFLYDSGLATSNVAKSSEITEGAFIKISASGFVHLNFCLWDQEYLSNIAMTTWVRADLVADKILNSLFPKAPLRCDNLVHRNNRLVAFHDYLMEERLRHLQVAQVDSERLGGAKLLSAVLGNLRVLNPSLRFAHKE